VDNLLHMRIGWVVGRYGNHPAVRWRFGAYAKLRGFVPIEANLKGTYDVVWLSQVADYTRWEKYPRSGAKLILDLCDDYLSEPAYTPKDTARELGKFVFRQHTNLRFSFHNVVDAMCRRADAVVVGSDIQMEHVKPICPEVVKIPDIHTDSLGCRKSDYRAGETFNIGWEGFPAMANLAKLIPVLRRLSVKYKLALHIVTSARQYRLRNHFPRDVRRVLEKECQGVQFYLYDWTSAMVSRILTGCDLAVIPLDMKDKFSLGKPANKLVFYWQLGIPVITSALQSYITEMEECGTAMYCRNETEWYDMLEHYIGIEGARREAAERAAKYVDCKYSESRIAGEWDRLICNLASDK
jgi:hypothetical protein